MGGRLYSREYFSQWFGPAVSLIPAREGKKEVQGSAASGALAERVCLHMLERLCLFSDVLKPDRHRGGLGLP
jgi:hypothetical protein